MKHDTSSRKATAKAQPIIKKNIRQSAVTVVSLLEKKAKAPDKKTKPIVLAATKPKIQKLKVASSGSKIKSAEKKVKLNKVVQTIEPKRKAKPVTAAASPKSKARKLKPIVSAKVTEPVAARKVKNPNSAKIKLNASEKSIKTVVKKPKANISVKKSKTVGAKNKPNVVTQKAKSPPKNNKAAKLIQTGKPKLQKVQPLILAGKIADKKNKIKSAKSIGNAVVGKVKYKGNQTKPVGLTKIVKPKQFEIIKVEAQKIKPFVSVKKVKTVENKIKTIIQPIERKPKKKQIKPISSAIFRGRKDRYDFKVFPLDADFEDVSAIYVISRRKIDREKKAHHALVCIGQTDSVRGEIKRHKNKCIKKHNANVISILPEADAKKRLKIEEDLRAAHAIVCNIS